MGTFVENRQMAVPKFSNKVQSFHGELKRRISEYFKQEGKSPTGNASLHIKAIILISCFIALYVHLVFFTPAPFWAILECIGLGGLTAAIGFNVMHDGAHGSFSKRAWLNQAASMTVNVLGANDYMWKTKHNVVHHAYTNIHGVDDDIEAGPILRLCEHQPYYKVYRYQHLYFWAAYSLLYLYWVFVTDYKKYFRGRVGPVSIGKLSIKDHISFWSFKLLHAFLFVVLPILTVGAIPWLIGFLVCGLFAGFVLSIVFQLAHTVEHTHFPLPNDSNKMDDEWAIHQIKTTANFATRNKVVSWLVGGLNFQIEHHLFPKISHIHYPAISRIIKKACQEYGIRYIEYNRVSTAVASHVAFLRQMGRNEHN